MGKHPQNQHTERIALTSEKVRDTATGNMQRKFCGVWTCGFWDMQTDRQTDRQRQADRQTCSSQYFAPLPWAKSSVC